MYPLRIFTLLFVLCIFFSCGRPENGLYSTSDAISFSQGGPGYEAPPTGDQYAEIIENPFVETATEPTSTFSVDADGGSYANVRRFLEQDKQLPPASAVRTEEFINYFDFGYPVTDRDAPISLNGEVSGCPWAEGHRLVRIGIQGQPLREKPASNYVFLVDVSGSMSSSDKLELLKSGMQRFIDGMEAEDYLSIVTYAAATRVHLPSTSGRAKNTLRKAVEELESGGSTNGGAGIVLAYEEAQEHFVSGGNNRVFIGTDGDFNVGLTSFEDLIALIEEKRETGVFLTVLGVGRGNYNEATMEQIANRGNGTYEYLDKVEQLEKVFLHETGKFHTVAKDVKVQVSFNPNVVKSYRLIGYENRVLNNEDFEDDQKDAGEIGADQNITALYEIVPQVGGVGRNAPAFTVDFRYKAPDSAVSVPLSLEIQDTGTEFGAASDQQRFVAAVAAFSLLLRGSEYKGTASYEAVSEWLKSVGLEDEFGYQGELRELVRTASRLK